MNSSRKTPKWIWKQVALKKKRAKSLEGMLCKDNKWGAFVVVKYHNTAQVLVRMIEEDRLVMVALSTVLNRSVRSLYSKTAKGIGYLGEGRYKIERHSGAYGAWKRGIESLPEKYHNFQVFAKDYYNGGLEESGDAE